MPNSMLQPGFSRAIEAAPCVGAHERAAELISRYPDLSKSQTGDLVSLFPRLSALDLALMMSDDDLAPKLEAFYAAHRQEMSPSLTDYAVIGSIIAFPIVMFLALVLASHL